MNKAHKKECVHCANYNAIEDYCSIHGKCDFIKLTARKVASIGRRDECPRDFFGDRVADDWWHQV
jgi:hypothetical protein